MAATRTGNLIVGVGGFGALLTAGFVAYLNGGINLTALRFHGNEPSISGSGTTSTNVDYSKWKRKALTATGGLAKYDTLTFSNPNAYTGAILEFCIDVKTAATPTTSIDCGIVTDAGTGTGTALFDNETLTRGVHCANVASTTEVIFGPDERIKCGSLTGTGQNLNATMSTRYREVQL